MFPPCTSEPGLPPPQEPKSPLAMKYVHAEVIDADPETFAFAPPSSHTCHAVVVRVTVTMCQELLRRSEAV